VSKLKFLFPLILSVCITLVAAAQTDCPTLVQAALSTVDAVCTETGRNQVCYGNISLTATPRDGVNNLAFDTSGDRASVTDIQSLQLSSMSVTDDSWGVALMRLQANLPDTLPGQNVTFLLFGDVQVDNAATDAPQLSLTTTGDVNVRLRPSTDTNNVMTSLRSGQTVVATGRLADDSWVRIKVEGDVRGVGWVSADFIEGDLNELAAVELDAPSWGPMQSFYFQTGVGDRPCAEAPDSGILIQTPEGSGKVTLNVNDVEIHLGSTVYLQAQPGDRMTVTVVEGQAMLEAGGQTEIVPAGTFSQVQLDQAGKATSAPSFPQPYDEAALQNLPLNLRVFDGVEITSPLTHEEITASLETTATIVPGVGSGLPPGGSWYQVNMLTVVDCPNPTDPRSGTAREVWYSTLTFNEDRNTLTVAGGWNNPIPLSRISENVYQGTGYNEYGDPTYMTVTFLSRTTYQISSSANFYNGTCGYNYDGNGEFRG
jgi:hypothetical protein